jgi:GrpB-like predicted nucleotidyltransferase (UPF0157 family)/adenylate kinase family enzyme
VSGDVRRKVKVVPYQQGWPEAFRAEAEAIKPLFGGLLVGIHHIGSTSMPGAAAKPIIDLLAAVTDISLVDECNNRMASIGYQARGEYGIPGRRFFIKDIGGERSHHLHVFQAGSSEIFRHLAFRDYLITHPDELDAYCRLKTELARQHPDDIEAYMDGKDAFIKDIDRRAAAEHCPQPDGICKAILLLGPTGAGKTPLGDLLQQEGLSRRRCFHFDFGSRLRRYAAAPTGLLSAADLEVVADSLCTGALLSDEHFSIAEKLLRAFVEEHRIGTGDLIILNGLPRHAGQAAALENRVQMTAVVVLDCAAPTVLERIRTDAGGDRGGRIDDNFEDVKRRLETFAEKTLPLVAYYEKRGVPIIRIEVGVCASAEDTLKSLTGRMRQTFG